MKLWLPLSLLVIALILAGSVVTITKNSVPKVSNPATTTETVDVKLTLQPALTPVRVNEEAVYNVEVSSQNVNVIGVEAYMTYDPQILAVTALEPGEVLPQAEKLLQNIDHPNGKIAYALGTKQPKFGNGTLFSIRVQGKSTTQGVQPILSFDQDKTNVAVETSNHSKRFSEDETKLAFEEKALAILP